MNSDLPKFWSLFCFGRRRQFLDLQTELSQHDDSWCVCLLVVCFQLTNQHFGLARARAVILFRTLTQDTFFENFFEFLKKVRKLTYFSWLLQCESNFQLSWAIAAHVSWLAECPINVQYAPSQNSQQFLTSYQSTFSQEFVLILQNQGNLTVNPESQLKLCCEGKVTEFERRNRFDFNLTTTNVRR